MFDDRVCPACGVLLPTGATRCVKCGRAVAPPRSPLAFIEWPTRVYPWLAARLGPAWGGVAAVLLFLVLFSLFALAVGLVVVLRTRQ